MGNIPYKDSGLDISWRDCASRTLIRGGRCYLILCIAHRRLIRRCGLLPEVLVQRFMAMCS